MVRVTHVVDGRIAHRDRYSANSLPAIKLLPRYKAWAYLPTNERAAQIGRQMYYMDASTGAGFCGSRVPGL